MGGDLTLAPVLSDTDALGEEEGGMGTFTEL